MVIEIIFSGQYYRNYFINVDIICTLKAQGYQFVKIWLIVHFGNLI